MYHLNPLEFPRKNTTVIILNADHKFSDGDKFFFTIKVKPDNDKTDSDALLKASWTLGETTEYDQDGNIPLTLSDEQTDIEFGDYYYDIKSVTTAGIANTLVFGEVKVLPVVTLEN